MTPPLKTHAAELRDLTARILIERCTLAGEHVERERALPLASGELPHVNVFMDASGEAQYQGGPRFLVTGKLQIKVTVERPRHADALADLDTLVAQVLDALFGDPDWVRTANQVLTFGVTATFKGDANQQQGEALIVMSCQWLEIVTLRPASPLTSAMVTLHPGPPDITAPIIAEFTYTQPDRGH